MERYRFSFGQSNKYSNQFLVFSVRNIICFDLSEVFFKLQSSV